MEIGLDFLDGQTMAVGRLLASLREVQWSRTRLGPGL